MFKFFLSSIPSGIEFWSVNHTLINENSGLKFFKTMKYFGEISKNGPKDLSGTNAYNTAESYW